ncbi:uncharacterized protein L969DRAFT_94758 [Mixia osmundae IAM 14324]|uniref:Uncharacterized protein n=1 Tax=Mixia osmundae (strain CBS 9802 / IAM 14324 / JCM 22182 / KY 12970) TaxID=764103 RepID=G7E457_MIXOS|nr:uncharacterized protein L969DRAFT_94758 [Mixia osmundae IAM 14324]KEI39713.1 hypothetical protein L969DRAFT_94758 [Mixia osmundae IAM 14324]GAA97617.1 hypothetical protein E5Q_04295 [Mixia osmundae IAM 14324]
MTGCRSAFAFPVMHSSCGKTVTASTTNWYRASIRLAMSDVVALRSAISALASSCYTDWTSRSSKPALALPLTWSQSSRMTMRLARIHHLVSGSTTGWPIIKGTVGQDGAAVTCKYIDWHCSSMSMTSNAGIWITTPTTSLLIRSKPDLTDDATAACDVATAVVTRSLLSIVDDSRLERPLSNEAST